MKQKRKIFEYRRIYKLLLVLHNQKQSNWKLEKIFRCCPLVERKTFIGANLNQENLIFSSLSLYAIIQSHISLTLQNWFLLSFVMKWKWEMSMSLKTLERHKDCSSLCVWDTDSYRRYLAEWNRREINIWFPMECDGH